MMLLESSGTSWFVPSVMVMGLSVFSLRVRQGMPTQNGFIESFNGRMRKKFIERDIFKILVDSIEIIMVWVRHCNE